MFQLSAPLFSCVYLSSMPARSFQGSQLLEAGKHPASVSSRHRVAFNSSFFPWKNNNLIKAWQPMVNYHLLTVLSMKLHRFAAFTFPTQNSRCDQLGSLVSWFNPRLNFLIKRRVKQILAVIIIQWLVRCIRLVVWSQIQWAVSCRKMNLLYIIKSVICYVYLCVGFDWSQSTMAFFETE